MEPLTFQAATYRPTAPFTGTLPLSLLRVKNMILTGLDDLLYMLCYKGSLNLGEPIPTGPLTGTISGSLNGTTITGAGTAFKTELRSGQFVFAGSDLLVVNEVVSDTVFTIYRALTAAVSAGSTGYRMPILFELGRKRGTLLQGNAHEFDKGNILATGEGTLRINGTALNATMVLSRKPRIAVYDPTAGTYTIFNLGLTPSTVAPTVTSVAGGVKNMQIGHYSLLLVPARTALNGAGNPGPKAEFDIAAPGDMAQVDVSAVTVDTTNGQTAYDVYASLSTQGGIQGPWFFLETVIIADIVGNLFTVEWEDSQIGRTGNEVDYDNDPPGEAGFIGTIVGYPIEISCNGKFGGTPGPSLIPAKPGNIDAWPAQWNVTSSPPEVILGIATALARLYLLTPKSLQQAQYTPSGNPQVPPVTVRPYWRVGFANAYQLVFVNQMLVGHSLMGPTRSVEGSQEVVKQTDFGGYVSSIMATWTNGHVLVEHDPDPDVDAVCFFHSADSKNSAGFWRTRVLVWGVRQEQWVGDVFIEDDTRDMIVCGVAQVDGHLEFLAGGRFGAAFQVETQIVSGGPITLSGNAKLVVTAAGMVGSPVTVFVPVLSGDSLSVVATKVRAALNANANVSAFFNVGGAGTLFSLRAKIAAANDATMNISIENDTCAGLTNFASSANTTAGVAGTVQVDTFRWNTISGDSVNYYASWQLTNAGAPRQDKEIRAIQVTGKFTEGAAMVFGYSQTESVNLSDIEDGVNSLSGSIDLGTQLLPQDLERLELNISNAALFTPRVGGTWDGTGDPDRLDKVVLEYQPIGMPR